MGSKGKNGNNLDRMEAFWNNAERQFRGWHGSSRRRFLEEAFNLQNGESGHIPALKVLMKSGMRQDDENILRYGRMCRLMDNMVLFMNMTDDEISDFSMFSEYMCGDNAAEEMSFVSSGQDFTSDSACVPDCVFTLDACDVIRGAAFCSPDSLLSTGHVLSCILARDSDIGVYQVSQKSGDFIQISDTGELSAQYHRLFDKAQRKIINDFEKTVLTILTEQVNSQQLKMPMVFLAESMYRTSSNEVLIAGRTIKYATDDCREQIGVEAVKGMPADVSYIKAEFAETEDIIVSCYCVRKVIH